jgi:hypothetical protein
MKLSKSIMIGVASLSLLPVAAFADGDKSSWDATASGERYAASGATTSDRALSDEEIRDIIRRSGASDGNSEVRYLGGPQTAIETIMCCENVEEQVETRTEIEETIEYIDAVTHRDITQPVKRKLIQPITREVLKPSVEDITVDRVYVTNRLEPRIDRDPAPAVTENFIPSVTTETVEEVTETYYDVLTSREVIQPIERTTVVPVQRRIVRPVTETVTNEIRYETRTAPVQHKTIEVPATVETITEDVTTVTKEEVTQKVIPYVAERNIYQPKTITTIQPVERQILRGTTETITEATRYEEERLPVRVETEEAPRVVETLTPKLTERTVLEVEDVYIDNVTRNVIQPVVVTTIQPVVGQVLKGRTETITNRVRYETETLERKVERVYAPDTVVNYIPQVTEEHQEEYSESYFEAVTHRDIHQPVHRKIIQPVEIRKVTPKHEVVTNPTRYETVRASLVVLNIGESCNCGH